jgi:hypothetical protein
MRHDHLHFQPGKLGVSRQYIAVAPVVARSAGHTDAFGLGPALAQKRPGRGAGAFHELELGYLQLFDGARVDFANLVRPKER